MLDSYFSYIFKLYMRNFIVVLAGIIISVVMIDYFKFTSTNSDTLSWTILYVFYTMEFRLSQFYPLAIVFAAVISYMKLVSTNTLVSLLSFGYTKRQLYLPFVLPAILIYFIMMLLHSSDFAYARERAYSIKHNQHNSRAVSDLFFKHNNTFVYVKELDPIGKSIFDLTVFELSNGRVMSEVTLSKAIFDGEYWIGKNAKMTSKRYNASGKLLGIDVSSTQSYKFLKDYKPKVISLIYKGDSLSIVDAVRAYAILKTQGLDSSRIRASLYEKAILPLFSFFIITMLFFRASFYSRYMRKDLVWALSLGGTMILWGLLYALYSLSVSGVLIPEFATLLPVGLLMAGTAYQLSK